MDMLTGERAKASLKKKGWSYRKVAPLLGVTFQHLSYVLNGHRVSWSLLARIHDLPACPHAKGAKGAKENKERRAA